MGSFKSFGTRLFALVFIVTFLCFLPYDNVYSSPKVCDNKCRDRKYFAIVTSGKVQSYVKCKFADCIRCTLCLPQDADDTTKTCQQATLSLQELNFYTDGSVKCGAIPANFDGFIEAEPSKSDTYGETQENQSWYYCRP